MDTDIQNKLMKKAGLLLARRAHSRGELKKRLAGMADDPQIESVLSHLEHLNLLNDADYAYNFALYRIRQQGWGPARVQSALILRQVSAPVIENALERVQCEAGEPAVFIVKYVRKRYSKSGLPSDPRGIRNLILHLRRRGFDETQIFGALRELIPASALQPFETGD